MVTIREIAAACHVSIATVSNVLNKKGNVSDQTRQIVLDKVNALNYVPNSVAKNLKTKKTHMIGIVAEDITIFSIPDIVDGITNCCEDNGYGITLANLRLYKKFGDSYYNKNSHYDQVADVLRNLAADQVEAIIYVSAHERALPCLPEVFPIPLVMCYAYSGTPGVPSIVVEESEMVLNLINYAVQQGHQRIGVITGKADSAHMQERLLGYQKALYQNGLLYDPSIICQGDWERSDGVKYTDYLLNQHVTAVFCMNDLMAGGVYDRLEELGLTPGTDMSVIGYDGRELGSYYKPPLTTAKLPLHDVGYRAGEIALKMLNPHDRQQILPVYRVSGRMIIRDSVQLIKTEET